VQKYQNGAKNHVIQKIGVVPDDCLIGVPCGQSNPPSLCKGLNIDLSDVPLGENFLPRIG
jgi:hypothetical protein